MLGEAALRARIMRRERRVALERLSVPILFEGERVLHDSRVIAEHADELAAREGRATLFPHEQLEALDRWLDRLELAKRALRLLATERMLSDEASLLAAMPAGFPHLVRRASLPMGRLAARFILDKYGGAFDAHDGRPSRDDREGLRKLALDVLGAADDALARRAHLVGEQLTFADLALVTTLQFVDPSPALSVVIPAFRDDPLRRALPRLLDARDRLLATHAFQQDPS